MMTNVWAPSSGHVLIVVTYLYTDRVQTFYCYMIRAASFLLFNPILLIKRLTILLHIGRDGFGPGPAQPKSARAYIPTWPKIGPGPKAAQETSAQIGLGPNFFGPGPAQENVGPDKSS